MQHEALRSGMTDRELGNKLWTRQQRNLLINNQDGISTEI